MLSNEQRAHDIAVAMLPKVIEMKTIEYVEEIAQKGTTVNEIGVDIYQEYKKLYEASLISVKRDFPTDE